MTLFNVSLDMMEGSQGSLPPWMLLEERRKGQTARAISRPQSRRRWIALLRGDPRLRGWDVPRRGNPRRRESLRWELLCGLDRPARRLQHVLLAGLPGSQSETRGHRLSECPSLPARMPPRHPRLRFWRVAPALRRAVSALR